MDNTRAILKNAFIDAQLVDYSIKQHTFSYEFEGKMQHIIKYQKGIFRLINTAGKKIACIVLSLLLCLTTVACSIDEVREPIVEEIKRFYVNVKEQLKGTKANEIAELFSGEVSKIVATNYVTTTPKEYVIEDEEKVAAFTKLLTTTGWGTPKNEFEANTGHVNYRFEFKVNDKTVTTLNICSYFPGLFGVAEIIYNGKSLVYNISERTYFDILAFTTQKYYLHKSDLEQPEKSQCLEWQRKAINGMTQAEKEEFGETFQRLHFHIEDFLLGNVSILKEPDSVYWKRHELERDEVFEDPITGTLGIDNTYHIMLDNFQILITLAKDAELQKSIITLKEDYIRAFELHDIGSIFAVHEVIHDYDYYVVNYPIVLSTEPPDWQGIDDYFGHLE